MENSNLKLTFIERTLKFLFFFGLIFISSYITTDYIYINSINEQKKINQDYNNNQLNTKTKPPINNNNQVNNQYNNKEGYYIIFKNVDPSIKQIEFFLAKNLHTLSPEEIYSIEQLRNKKITELMAKKFLSLTANNETKTNENN